VEEGSLKPKVREGREEGMGGSERRERRGWRERRPLRWEPKREGQLDLWDE